MKVILRQDYEKLGKLGDIVDVKDGFARNFLLPKRIAYLATEGNMRMLVEEKKQQQRKLDKARTRSEKIAQTLTGVEVTIAMKVGEEDRLFGSVTSQMVADALEKQTIVIDKREIVIDEPIRALGSYDVALKLDGGVSASVKVNVVKE